MLSVITDKKIGVSSGGSIVDYYKAEVLSQTDYYPFGMEEPGRSMSAIPYPYAFNGKRMENVELYISNQYDYGMRYYDARVGRFYSVDPLTRKYPELSPYAFAGNRPIEAIDLDGAETYLETQGSRLQNEARLMNDVMIHQQQQRRQLLLQNRAIVSPSDPCESCTVERTNAANQARRIEGFKQIIGPVGGGGPNFGQGLVEDPFFQMSTAIVAPPEAGMLLGGFQLYTGVKNKDYLSIASGGLLLLGSGVPRISTYEGSIAKQLRDLEESIPGAHFYSRHGAGTTLEEQYIRATTGLTPEGITGKPRNSSRFLSDELQLQSLNKAYSIYEKTKKSAFIFDMGTRVGEGYLEGGGSVINTTQVRAVFKDNQIYTLYPKLQ